MSVRDECYCMEVERASVEDGREPFVVLECGHCRYARLMDACPHVCGADDAFLERNAGRLAHLRALMQREHAEGRMVFDRGYVVRTLRRAGVLPSGSLWRVIVADSETGAIYLPATAASRHEAERKASFWSSLERVTVTLVESRQDAEESLGVAGAW